MPNDGRAGWGSYRSLCFYCKAAVTLPLPCVCWHCGLKLSEEIRPEMKLTRLVDLCFGNGKRLMIGATKVQSS